MEQVNEISGTEASELLDLAVNGKLVSSEEENIEDTENEADVETEGDTDEVPDEDALENSDEVDAESGDSTSQDIEDNGSEETEKDIDTDSTDVDDTNESDDTEDIDDDENTESDELDSDIDEESEIDKSDDGVDGDIEESGSDLDGDSSENNNIDVEEYNRLKQFYDKLTTTEFKVNGRKRTGFTEVEDLIKAQQAYGGLEKKFQAIKEVQPFMKSMVDNGFIANPEKYELAVRAVNGDVEALKEVMKNKGIDPLTLDLDEGVNYKANNDILTDSAELAYNEAREFASDLGVAEKLDKALFDEFDDASRSELFKDPDSIKANSIALAEQIENGLYDQVMDEVDKLSFKDSVFKSKPMIEKYNYAANIVNERNKMAYEKKLSEAGKKDTPKVDPKKVKKEKEKILNKRKKAEYEAKAKEQEKKLAADRRRATKASKPKAKSSSTKKQTPLDLPSEEFSALWDELLALNDK